MLRRLVLTCAPVLVVVMMLLSFAHAAERAGVLLRFAIGEVDKEKVYTVTVSGRITDAQTRQPIPDAKVRGHIVIWRYQGPDLFEKCPYQEATCDAEGRYELKFSTLLTTSGPMQGKDGIGISVSAPGHETRPHYVEPNVTPDKTTFNAVNVALAAGKLVQGKLVDQAGQPLADARVEIQNNWNGDWSFFGDMGRTTTAPDGSFQLWRSTDVQNVLSGKPWLYVAKEGYGIAVFGDVFQKDSLGTLVVPAGSTLKGKVVDRQGKPLAGWQVIADPPLYERHRVIATTDADGRYEIKGIPSRDLVRNFCLWHSGSAPVADVLSVTVYARPDVQQRLNDSPSRKVSLTQAPVIMVPDLVAGEASPVTGHLLTSKNPLALQGLLVRLDTDWGNMVEADADGHFRFPYVAPGQHRLTAYLPNNLRGDRGIGHADVTVEPGKPLDNVQIQLETLAEVRVQLLDAHGAPLEGISAGATWSKNGDGFWTEGTKSDKEGWAVLLLYPDQIQYVRGFDHGGSHLVSEGYEEVHPQAGQVIDNVRITMVPTASLHAHLSKEDAAALAGKRLLVRLQYAGGMKLVRTLQLDASGGFDLEDLAPGIVQLKLLTMPTGLTASADQRELKAGQSVDLGQLALSKVQPLTGVTFTLTPQFNLGGLKTISLKEGEKPKLTWGIEGLEPDYLGIVVVPAERPDVQNIPNSKLWQMENDRRMHSWAVMGLPGDITSAEFGQKWPDVKGLDESQAPDKLATGYYLVLVLGYQGEFRQGEGRQPSLYGGVVWRVGNPPERPKLDTSKLTPQEMTPKLKAWVEDFFHGNFRDITARKPLEWGAATRQADGNWSIRYKFEATIWDKDKVVQNRIFTFTPEGGFVSVKNAEDDSTDH